ncbi:MAG: HTH domain-containing protein [Verrucomicrobia bacterium]|nr:HTH domain-containing protein [Verrucomicrobiota bacterium]
MDEEDFFGKVSNPRNKELMRVFRDVEMVESLGSEMPRVLQSYGKECFQFMNHFIRIVIPFTVHENVVENVVEEHPHNQKDISKSGGKTDSRNVVEELTDRQRDIVELIKQQVIENVVEDVVETSATLSKKLSVTPCTIQRDLDTLQRLGVIYRVGSDKDGHWEVIKWKGKRRV